MSEQNPDSLTAAPSTLPKPEESDQSRGKRKKVDSQAGKKVNKFKSSIDFPCDSDPVRKDQHNAIEKKRRHKINTCIQDIRLLILDSSENDDISCKSDKLSIFKATLQFLRRMRGIPNVSAKPDCPSFLLEEEIKTIISKMDCGFIIVADALEGSIVWEFNLDLHLGYEKGELFGTSIYSLLKQEDITTYKLNSAPNINESIRLVNKRSFICNFLRKASSDPLLHSNPLETHHYLPVLISGVVEDIKTSALLQDRAVSSVLGECIKCFVAIGQGLTTEVLDVTQDIRENVKVLSREGPDGKIEHIYDSVFYLMGYTPSELIGHTFWEFIHPHDIKRLHACIFEASNIRNYTDPIVIRLKQKSGLYRTVSVKKLAVRHPTQNIVTSFISCIDEIYILAENWENVFPADQTIDEQFYDPMVMMDKETFIPRMFPNEIGLDPAQIPSYPNVIQPQDFEGELASLFDTPIYLKDAVEKYEYAQNFVPQPFEGPVASIIPTSSYNMMGNFADIFSSQPF